MDRELVGAGWQGEALTCCVILHKSHPSLGLVICHVRSLGRGSPRMMSGSWSTRALMKEAMEWGKGQAREGRMQNMPSISEVREDWGMF